MGDSNARALTEVRILAPIATVWAHLRDPALIANWFGWDAETLAEEIRFIFGTAVADEAAHRLDFGEWEGSSDHFELQPDPVGTMLRITRRSAVAPAADTYDAVIEGWISFAAQLRLLLENHPGQQRRTIYLSGKFPDGDPPLSTVLNLQGLRDAAIGSTYGADLALGDTIEGTAWHRSRHQIGLQVPAWGDGLLIVTDSPGGGNVIATTFGLSDADFATLKDRWDTWWAATWPPT